MWKEVGRWREVRTDYDVKAEEEHTPISHTPYP
jgi:hypothetical protein